MYAMVVSTEIIGQNAYTGNDVNKLVINCVFRVGGAAILLSNSQSDRLSSKYQLVHNVHTNTASSDTSYSCIFREEDSQGIVGVTVTKSLLVEARKAITAHITTLGKLVLPTSDKILFALNYLIRKLHLAKTKPYIPDFRRAINHFFPHVGGSVVINEVERTLKLDVEAPRMTLYRFGNLSSSTVWYELAYAEAKRKIKKGDRVWQFAFGSGFKCSSVIWHAMKSADREKINPWFDEIDDFPGKLNSGPVSDSYFEETR